MKKLCFLTALAALLLSGCARYYIINVDSINSQENPPDKTYVLTAGNSGTSASDLQFGEYARYLSKVLSSLGYVLSSNRKQASLEIYLSYGVGDPESHVYTYAEPVWGQVSTDVSTYSTQYTTSNVTTTVSTTNINPEYGVMGYTTKTGVYTAYKKFILIDAYDIKTRGKDSKPNHLWKTTISSLGETKDLRKLFPLMLVAAKKYIGGNTGEELEMQFPEESEEVKALRGN